MSYTPVSVIKNDRLKSISNKDQHKNKHQSTPKRKQQELTYQQFIDVVENSKQLQPQQLRKIYNRKRNNRLKSVYMNPPIPLLKLKKYQRGQFFYIPGLAVNQKSVSQFSHNDDDQNSNKKQDLNQLFSVTLKQTSIQKIKQIYSSRKKQYLNNIRMRIQSKSDRLNRQRGDSNQIRIIEYSNHQQLDTKQKRNQKGLSTRISQSAKFKSREKTPSAVSANRAILRKEELSKDAEWNKNAKQFSHIPRQQEAIIQRKLMRQGQNILSYKQFSSKQKLYQKINIQSILRRKYQNDFRKYMQGYLTRLKLPQGIKIFIFDSKDNWVRKCLLQKGWYQNQNKQSNAFHLKWTTKVSKNETFFREQLVNHFQESDKLTSKSGLIKATRQIQQLKKLIPRSYDLSSQYIQFIDDYKRTCFTSLLRKISKFIKSYQRKHQIFEPSKIYPQFTYMINSKDIIDKGDQKDKPLILHIPYTILLCAYLIDWKNRLENEQDWNKNFIQLNEKSLNKIFRFAKLNPPYYDFYEYQTSPYSKKQKNDVNLNSPQKTGNAEKVVNDSQIRFGKSINEYNIVQTFNAPSQKLISIVLSLDEYFSNKLPYHRSDGVNNYWIKKPSTSSKGIGIRLQTNLQNLLKNKQNYIVQKYIQECAIISDWSILHQKKFDLRVWVLVKSFTPLEAYYYRDFYAKIAPEKYDLEHFQDLKSHLTNYSQHKQSFKNKHQSVIYGKQLLQKISKQTNSKQKFSQIFYGRLQILIQSVLKQYQGVIKSCKSSFELYGFDIIIDSDLQLHLLQANLSPACNERVNWLSQMLKQMTYSMIQLVTQNMQGYNQSCLKQKGLWKSL